MTGAVRPERIVSAMMPASTRRPPPNFFRVSRIRQQHEEGEQLWRDQHAHRACEHPGRQDRILRRPLRKQRISLREIFGPDELRLQRDQDSEHQKDQPERRGEIRSDSRQQMKPRYPVKAAGRKQRQMLQIALAPAPVARGKIRKRGRRFLVAAAEASAPCGWPSRRAASTPPR